MAGTDRGGIAMKIKEIRAATLRLPKTMPPTQARRSAWTNGAEVANPASRYPKYRVLRSEGAPPWEQVGCVVVADDGTWGFGMTDNGAPVASIINDHLGPVLVGENCMATEKLWDIMFRLTAPYSSVGLASYAISAVDLALWDLKGKLLGRPVYELLGGPARDRVTCYATGNDTDWNMDLVSRQPSSPAHTDRRTASGDWKETKNSWPRREN
ncbi:MAG TPA: hypothetical protein DCP37_12650 [Dehalococcoidia bacterium]|nr:hypothetical protein [Dehalococcoidia bacterium]